MKTMLTAAALLAALPALALADDAPRADWGRAGILSSANKAELPAITLSSGMPLAEAPWVLTSGTYYEFEIIGDGSAELAMEGFFRAIWIDDAGEMEIGFVAIKPGAYVLRIPNSTGETQRVAITIQ